MAIEHHWRLPLRLVSGNNHPHAGQTPRRRGGPPGRSPDAQGAAAHHPAPGGAGGAISASAVAASIVALRESELELFDGVSDEDLAEATRWQH